MQIKQHPKHKDVSSLAAAEYRFASGDSVVRVLFSARDPFSIPHPAVGVFLSVAEAREMAAGLLREADAAEKLGAE